MAKILPQAPGRAEPESRIAAFCAYVISPILVWAGAGFLFGRAALFGELWPLSFAYIAALRAVDMAGWGFSVPIAVAAGLISVVGIPLALPYCAAFVLLWLVPGKDEKSWEYWLIALCLLIKTPIHYGLQRMPIVFVVGLTECVLAVPFYRYFRFTLQHCLEKGLAAEELRALLLGFALFVSFSPQVGGFALRPFLFSVVIVLGGRLDGLRINSLLGPSLALLMLLLGEPTHLVLYVVIASLLTGVFARHRWGYYLAPFLALIFTMPAPADLDTLQFLLTLMAGVWTAWRIPERHVKHLAHLVPGTEAFERQKRGHDEHLKQMLDQKIEQYLTVFEELETTLLGVDEPILLNQMQGIIELLEGMKESFVGSFEFTRDLEARLLKEFFGHDPAHISVVRGADGLEVFGAMHETCGGGCVCEQVARFCTEELGDHHYGVVNYNCRREGTCGFRIIPYPRYQLQIGRAKVAQAEISGDSQVSFEITNSKVAILLSDGMGVGWRAHTESSVAVRLLERMIKAGYDLSAAVALVNRLLLMRNKEEMFVTIDLVVVDLFTGQMEFVKIGSAPSFIKRGREVEIIYNHALPVGVLSQVEVEADRRILKEGEVLIMATDGVLDAQRTIVRKEEWMCWNLRRLQANGDPAAMAAEILQNSLEINQGRIRDDMMVVVARLIPTQWEMDVYRRTGTSGQ